MEPWRIYLRHFKAASEAVDPDQVVALAESIQRLRDRSGTAYVVGNGGSAANAEHLVLHLIERKIKAMSLMASLPSLTAYSNDYGYARAPAALLDNVARAGDMVIALSTSGRSENIRHVLETGRVQKLETCGLYGDDGGVCLELTDCPVLIPRSTVGVVEDLHSAIIHWLRDQL